MLIQAYDPESAVEAFNLSVLHRLARFDVMPSLPAWDPPENGLSGPARSVPASSPSQAATGVAISRYRQKAFAS